MKGADYERAAELRDTRRIPAAQEKAGDPGGVAQSACKESDRRGRTSEVIAEVVSQYDRRAADPSSRSEESRPSARRSRTSLDARRWSASVEAVMAVARGECESARAVGSEGSSNRPMGSFIFVGPSGVGKTLPREGTGRVPVRRRRRPHLSRHVRVHGEAQRQSPDRCASGIRRIRRRWPAHRTDPSTALRRGASR